MAFLLCSYYIFYISIK